MITLEKVEHVAKLARLELLQEEKEKFSKQLGEILHYVEQMNEVDTEGIEPMSHPFHVVNVMREDIVMYDTTREELFLNAPEQEDGFFKVPKIV